MKAMSFFVLVLLLGNVLMAREPLMVVRIHLSDPEDAMILNDMNLDYASLVIKDHADAVVTQNELIEIRRRGFDVEIIQREEDVFIPPAYHTVDETWFVLDSLHQLYPDITELDTCGISQRYGMPIPRFTISNNVGIREDEPAALLDAMHHAREPIGNEVCLYTMKWILDNYPDSADAQRWVDSMELQFVPIVNPEGWQYVTDSSLSNPWWRKNLRDNANNGGPIDPYYDGVDLNRNYDWRWEMGGSTDPSSWVYRGPYPNSESEVQALIDLGVQRKYVVGISYHSYGLDVLYPGRYLGQYTPDATTLLNIAQNMCNLMSDYSPGYLESCNMSPVWFYGQIGTYDFLIETAISFIPEDPDTIAIENAKNFAGIRYLLNRTFYSGITGTVRDSTTLQPLEATVEVLGLSGDTITPRTTDSQFGRFYRLLMDGNYSMRFSAPSYVTKTIANIAVTSDSLTKLDVLLVPGTEITEGTITKPGNAILAAWPNPFSTVTDIRYRITDNSNSVLRIYDSSGKLVRDLSDEIIVIGQQMSARWDGTDDTGRRLSAGIYFVSSKQGVNDRFGKLIMIR